MGFVTQNKKPGRPDSKKTVTKNIPDRYVAWKKRWAAWMGNRFNRLPLKGRIITMLCFMVLTGGYSIFLVASAFKKKSSEAPSITHISIPRHIKSNVQSSARDYMLYSKEYQRIHRFRMYMDSLYKNPSGRRLYESIIRRHPGLMDSVYMVENRSLKGKNEKNR